MIRDLDIAALRSFIAIIDTGGVTRAAERLHVTQSAISMRLKRLEDALGLALFDRNNRVLTPTAEGEQFLGYARRIVGLNDETVDRLTAPRFEGEVIFGVPHDLVYPLVPGILRRFDRDFPRVRVKLLSSYTTVLKEQFARSEIDVMLTTELAPPAPEDGLSLCVKPLVWMGAPGGRAWLRDPLPYASARRCLFRPLATAALDAAGRAWEAAVDADDEGVAVASAVADLAIVAMFNTAYSDRLAPIEHGGRLPELPPFHVNLYAAEEGRARLPAEFARYVREAFANCTAGSAEAA